MLQIRSLKSFSTSEFISSTSRNILNGWINSRIVQCVEPTDDWQVRTKWLVLVATFAKDQTTHNRITFFFLVFLFVRSHWIQDEAKRWIWRMQLIATDEVKSTTDFRFVSLFVSCVFSESNLPKSRRTKTSNRKRRKRDKRKRWNFEMIDRACNISFQSYWFDDFNQEW